MATTRRPVYFNDATSSASCAAANIDGPSIAAELGLRGVFVKDESSRFGLPSFKILGASWGIVKALANKLDMPSDTKLEDLSAAANAIQIQLFAATDGNHGRAVAFMAKMLSLDAHIFVPEILDRHTCGLISGEGAIIHVVSGDYDFTVQKASEMANATNGGLLVQDTAFPGYEQIPSWIVEGYSTMLYEVDQQLLSLGMCNTIVITPVGVGSLAHAVAKHCKSRSKPVSVVTVEPDTAACLYESLKSHSVVSLDTSPTIMSGMNCGTVSLTAWDDLRQFVDASTTISCFESHSAVQYLTEHGIQAGPCGAASLAALKLIASTQHVGLDLDRDAVVVLLSTEGTRPYKTPSDVSIDDPTILSQTLGKIKSQSLESSSINEAKHNDVTNYIISWFEHRGIKSNAVHSATDCSTTITAIGVDGLESSVTFSGKDNIGGDDADAILATAMVSIAARKPVNT